MHKHEEYAEHTISAQVLEEVIVHTSQLIFSGERVACIAHANLSIEMRASALAAAIITYMCARTAMPWYNATGCACVRVLVLARTDARTLTAR